jgi:hypothetical protein
VALVGPLLGRWWLTPRHLPSLPSESTQPADVAAEDDDDQELEKLKNDLIKEHPQARELFFSLSPAAKELLAHAKEFELLSLDPLFHGSPEEKTPNFHGFKVLGSTRVTNREECQKIGNEIAAAVARAFEYLKALCFIPRHGIRASADGKVIEMLICFECYQIKVYVDGTLVQSVATTPGPQKRINAVLRAANVPLRAQAPKQTTKPAVDRFKEGDGGGFGGVGGPGGGFARPGMTPFDNPKKPFSDR